MNDIWEQCARYENESENNRENVHVIMTIPYVRSRYSYTELSYIQRHIFLFRYRNTRENIYANAIK